MDPKSLHGGFKNAILLVTPATVFLNRYPSIISIKPYALYQHIVKSCTPWLYNVVSPTVVVSWFMTPSFTMVIAAKNPSCSDVHQLNAICRGPHIVLTTF